jgi:hypothetical protein
MKTETLLGFGLIGLLVWQIAKRRPTTTIVGAAPGARAAATRWEDVARQGIITAGDITRAALSSPGVQSAAASGSNQGCRDNAQSEVTLARAQGVESNDWLGIEEQIYQACIAGIS